MGCAISLLLGLCSFFFFFETKININHSLTLSLQESIMETCSVVLTFETVDEILWCDHSNETFFSFVWYTICFSIFCKMKFGIVLLHSWKLRG